MYNKMNIVRVYNKRSLNLYCEIFGIHSHELYQLFYIINSIILSVDFLQTTVHMV